LGGAKKLSEIGYPTKAIGLYYIWGVKKKSWNWQNGISVSLLKLGTP